MFSQGPYFPSPDNSRFNFELVGWVVTATATHLMMMNKKITEDVIKQTASHYAQRYGVPLSLVPDIVKFLIRTATSLKIDPFQNICQGVSINKGGGVQIGPEYNAKEYIMFTNKNIEGKKLIEDEYDKFRKKCERRARDYKFIIDEVKYECFFNGRKIEGKKKPVRPAWRAFIYLILNKKNTGVTYSDIFEYVHPKEKYSKDETFNIVQKWISLFRKYLDEDDDLRWFFKPVDDFGYEFQEGAAFRYCIFKRLLST